MNGARSIFMRKGYLLTALAAIVLLAVPASAQVTVTGPAMNTVTEGGTATYTVQVKGYVPANTENPADVMVDLGVFTGAGTGGATDGEPGDLSTNLGTPDITFELPANASMTDAAAFSATGSISVYTTQDVDAEDERFTFVVKMTAGDLDDDAAGAPATLAADEPTMLIIDDDETQTYVLAVSPATQKPTEGTPVTVSLSAVPEHDNGSETLTVNIDKPAPAYTLTGLVDNEVEIGGPRSGANGMGTATLTVNQANPDGNRASDTVTLTAYSGRAGASKLAATLAITLADLNALPAVTAMVVGEDGKALDPQPESVTEGESVMIKVMVLTAEGEPGTAAEALKVELVPSGSADARDYALSTQTLDIASDGGESSPVTLMAELDEDVGKESLMFDAVVSGESANGTETSTSDGVLSLYIEDATATKINTQDEADAYPKIRAALGKDPTNTEMNTGDTGTIMTSDLFDVMDGYMASYGVSVEGDSASASASGESVTINALMAGEAKITVTGTASMSTTSLIPTQTVSNVAELTFPVMVVDTELVVTTLSAEPMEIEAGGTTMITATANRAVTAGDGDVEIALAVVPEGAGTLDPESIMIAMGDMSGSAMLTANESLTVVATGSGVTGLMQVAVTVTDGPPPEEPEDLVVTLSADPMEIEAGGTTTITATANRAVTADDDAVKIDLTVEGDGTLDADSIMIAEGDMSGSAMLTATKSVTVKATGSGISGEEQVMVTVVPVPVPALPLIAQWLLGLGLMGGGARQLFRRRRQGS